MRKSASRVTLVAMAERARSLEEGQDTAEPRFVEAGGHRLEYMWHGPGPAEAPTLVLLHEGLGSVASWKDFPAALATATGCGVLVYSRWGYGRSEPIRVPRPFSYMHDEARHTLPEVLVRLGVQDPILVGHSDGASIALIYAGSWAGIRAGIWFESRTDGAMAQAPAPRALLLEAPHVFVEEQSLASITQIQKTFRAGPDLRQSLSRYHEDVDGAFQGWNDAWLHPDFARWNIEAYLEGVTCPVLLLQGNDDEYGTRKQVDAIAAKVAGPSEIRMLADCGHVPHDQSREAVLTAMTAFVEKIVNPTSAAHR